MYSGLSGEPLQKVFHYWSDASLVSMSTGIYSNGSCCWYGGSRHRFWCCICCFSCSSKCKRGRRCSGAQETVHGGFGRLMVFDAKTRLLGVVDFGSECGRNMALLLARRYGWGSPSYLTLLQYNKPHHPSIYQRIDRRRSTNRPEDTEVSSSYHKQPVKGPYVSGRFHFQATCP
jgi:hypothetical protein